jgi:hypothetical protein
VTPPNVIARGDSYALTVETSQFALWSRNSSSPVQVFPNTSDGWLQAVAAFRAYEPTAPIIGPPGTVQPMADGAVSQPYTAFAFGQPPGTPAPGNSIGNAGGIVGIIGAVLSLIPIIGILIGLLMGVIAVVLGAVGLARQPKGMAVTGLVLGILTIVFKLIPGVNLL